MPCRRSGRSTSTCASSTSICSRSRGTRSARRRALVRCTFGAARRSIRCFTAARRIAVVVPAPRTSPAPSALARAAELAVEEREAECARLEALRDSLEAGPASRAFPTRSCTAAARRARRTFSTSPFRAPTASRCSWRSTSPASLLGGLGVSERKRHAIARAARDGRSARARGRRRAHEPRVAHDAGVHRRASSSCSPP